jgi:exopolysaccharide biosynthesis polyprenyl glycosylphosphotransferase
LATALPLTRRLTNSERSGIGLGATRCASVTGRLQRQRPGETPISHLDSGENHATVRAGMAPADRLGRTPAKPAAPAWSSRRHGPRPTAEGRWAPVAKRAEDLVLGIALLVLTLPLMVVIAIAIRLDTPGPALFRQTRRGLDNRPFAILKFRTMVYMPGPELTVPQARRHDPRVTRVGRVLRRTSLDELPQLFNVLKGEMSLVGPRPHALAHGERYGALIAGYADRHRVPPGITGWAQVHGLRGETDTLEKMQRRVDHDLAYLVHRSLLLDLRILALTVRTVWRGRNAY